MALKKYLANIVIFVLKIDIFVIIDNILLKIK